MSTDEATSSLPDPVAIAREHQKVVDDDGFTWSTCAECGESIYQHWDWSHKGGTPPTDHDAETDEDVPSFSKIVANESRLADEVERLQGELADFRPKLDIARGGMGAWMERAKELEAERDALSAQRAELRRLVERAVPIAGEVVRPLHGFSIHDHTHTWLGDARAALGDDVAGEAPDGCW